MPSFLPSFPIPSVSVGEYDLCVAAVMGVAQRDRRSRLIQTQYVFIIFLLSSLIEVSYSDRLEPLTVTYGFRQIPLFPAALYDVALVCVCALCILMIPGCMTRISPLGGNTQRRSVMYLCFTLKALLCLTLIKIDHTM